MITPETLRKFAPKIKDPETHANALETARQTSSVTTRRRLCHFLGQVFVETAGFSSMVENLNYKTPERLDAVFSAVNGTEDAKALIKRGPEAIANRVYAKKLGNGNEASGDGWRYRGSGYKQLTGRGNYKTIGAIVGLDLENNPELAREPDSAAKIAFAFWDAHACSDLADKAMSKPSPQKSTARPNSASRNAETRPCARWAFGKADVGSPQKSEAVTHKTLRLVQSLV